MKLKDLVNNIECELINFDGEIEISQICLKDSECKKNSLFCCIEGNKFNGNKFIKRAKQKGAVAILTSEPIWEEDIIQIVVKRVRKAINLLCDKFYDYPYKKLKTIAIVGTNGKTTICELTSKILNDYGIKCAKIGTLGAKIADKVYQTGFTTPDTPAIYQLLKESVDNGCKAVCMELSAHAIFYQKADFKFDVIAFTNCTPDHLDFFGDFQKYKEVKLSAFNKKRCKLAVVNGDDMVGKQITCLRKSGTITYGISDPADVFAIDLCEKKEGVTFIANLFDSLYEIKSGYLGVFNVYNMLAVATVCALCGVKTSFIAQKLSTLAPISGRMEKISDKMNIYVDYAHTPDGLKNALETLNKIKGKGRLICIFGCGGNRDRSKREIMGQISGEYADFTIITSDNPRFEEENFIISEIERGVRLKTRDYITVRDREQAIEYAVQMANADDFLLIAGKGCEEYQERMGTFKRFSDKEIACSLVKNKYD